MGQASDIAHLFRRAGFGAQPAELASAVKAGYSATVSALIEGLAAPDPAADAVPVPSFTPIPFGHGKPALDPAAQKAFQHSLAVEKVALTNWWLARMVAAANPLKEKLTFLLHGQFPTAISKVQFPLFMYQQNQLFRSEGSGDFAALTRAVAAGPAMLLWLDAASDRLPDPNENFARELMERFTMGIGTYNEADVRAAAYCFTGWRLDLATGQLTINPHLHSIEPQTFLGTPGVNSGDQVIDLATHSQASARYVPMRLWSHLAYPVTTADPVVSDLAPSYAANRNVAELLRAIFAHPAFTSPAATGGLIKQPTEYVVGALRAFGFTPQDILKPKIPVQATLARLGQVLFDPPSVGGWPQNQYWLSTAAALARWRFARWLVSAGDISMVADASPASRVDAAAEMLSGPPWTTATAHSLRQAAGDPGMLLTLALTSPEYVSN